MTLGRRDKTTKTQSHQLQSVIKESPSLLTMSIEYTVFKGSNKGIVESKSRVESLGPHDVLIRITHSGVCGTDDHFKEKDMVLGHEGVGVVQEVGESVSTFKV